MIYLYNFCLVFLALIALPVATWRLLAGKDSLPVYRQKLGHYDFPPPEPGGVWIHAVSVGETNAAIPMVDEFLKRNPKIPVTFTTGTTTGMELAKSRLNGVATLAYFPFDLPFAVKSALSFFSPRLVVLLETEIWPNFLYRARKSGVKTILVNGRLSDSSYARYKAVRPFFSPFIGAIDRFLMQSELDADRIKSLGAAEESLRVTGNIKFDKPLPGESSRGLFNGQVIPSRGKADMRRRFGIPQNGKVIILSSSHAGEDELFLDVTIKLMSVFKELYPIIAPRHVHRASAIRQLCIGKGFAKTRMYSIDPAGSKGSGGLLVLDTIGDLADLYGAVDIAVIGGSFMPHGGQNPLEAAGWKVPVIFGPHMHNFRDISDKLVESGGAVKAADGDELAKTLHKWLTDEDGSRKAGLAGYKMILENRGALRKSVETMEEFLKI